MEESSETLLIGVVVLIALTIGLAIALVLLTVAMDQPWLRFCLMAAMAALGLFLRRTFVIGALGFVIGLIGTLIMTVPDFVPIPELVVPGDVSGCGRSSRSASPRRSPPTCSSHRPIPRRCSARSSRRACRRPRTRWLAGWGADAGAGARRGSATAGIARMLALLQSAEIVHPSLRPRHAQQSALITLVDRLVTAAAALELLPRHALRAGRARAAATRRRRAARRVRRALADGRAPEPAPPAERGHRTAMHGSAVLPVLVELEHVVDLMQQALGTRGRAAAEVAPLAEPRRLFVPDAFTNPEYLRYALKGSLAVMICYIAAERGRLARHPHLHHHLHDRRADERGRDDPEGHAAHRGRAGRRGDGLPRDPAAHPGHGVDHVADPAGRRRAPRSRRGSFSAARASRTPACRSPSRSTCA